MDRVFEYCAILHPTKDERDGGDVRAEFVLDIDTVIAASEEEVKVIAARRIPESYLDRLDRVEVAVRPF